MTHDPGPTSPAHPVARRALVLPFAVLVAVLSTGCAEPAFAAPVLSIELRGGAAEVRVTGEPGLDVFLVANRPWRGEHELFPGLVGLRCRAQVRAEDRQAGAGVQLSGQLHDEVTIAVISADRLQSLPVPAVFQAVAIKSLPGGARTMALSNAWRFERDAGVARIEPWSVAWGLGQELGRVLGWLAAPLVLLFLLRHLPRPVAPMWLLALALVATALLRATTALEPHAEGGERAPPLLVWPDANDELAVLERWFGGGIGDLIDATVRARRAGEAVSIVLGAKQGSGRDLLAAHLAQRIADARVVHLPTEAAAPGLAIWFEPLAAAQQDAARRGDLVLAPAEVPADDTTPKERLASTATGALWRLGARR